MKMRTNTRIAIFAATEVRRFKKRASFLNIFELSTSILALLLRSRDKN